jgi:hypothetical protein
VNCLSYFRLPQPFGLAVVLLFLAAVAGCDRNEVQTYKTPKEKPKMSMAGLPPGWDAAPPGEMRVASFHVQGEGGKGADVSVIPLPGMAGDDLANVNRWRGQVQQPPVTAAELPNLSQPVDIGGEKAQLYEQAGQPPGSNETNRILAAVLRRDGTAWFFKMTGDDDLVAKQKPAFVQYLKTFDFSAVGTERGQPSLPPSHPPIGNAATAPESTTAAGADPGKPEWQVPAEWKEVSGGQFLAAKFLINGADNSQAAVNVSLSGGGLTANVNRWRVQQLGLEALSEEEINKLVTSVDLEGGKATLIEMDGTSPQSGKKERIVGAIVPRGEQAWFFKLMGPKQLVEQHKEAFVKFVQTAKYH